MRTLALVCVVTIVGCTEDNPGYEPGFHANTASDGGSGGGPRGDGGARDFAQRGGASMDLATPSTDSPDLTMPAPPPDLAMPGGPGASCHVSCDCQAGLVCWMGQCQKGLLGPVYCCESMNCPGGQTCQHQSGQYDRCGGMGGDPMWCRTVACQTNDGCKQIGCGAGCDPMSHHCL